MIFRKKDERLRCSFCSKQQDEVRKLIAGPTVFICDECIEICNAILADDGMLEARSATGAQTDANLSSETFTVHELTPAVACPHCGRIIARPPSSGHSKT